MTVRERSLPTLVLAALTFFAALHAHGQDHPRGRGRTAPRVSPLLQVIDVNADGNVSPEELSDSAKALLKLDGNGDGNLTLEEWAPAIGEENGRDWPRASARFRVDLVLTALDKDGDGELFDDELTDAVVSLGKLDRNGDGQLTENELRPNFERAGRAGAGGVGRTRQGGALDPTAVDLADGVARIPDRKVFEMLSYQGQDVSIDTHLSGLEFVKFLVTGVLTEEAKIYFMNTEEHRAHMMFARAVGLPRHSEGQMRGVLIYWPMLMSTATTPGLYTFEFEPNDSYPHAMIQIAHDLIGEFAPVTKGRLAYNVLPFAKERYTAEREKYQKYRLPVFEMRDRYRDIGYLPLHAGQTFGRLRLMKPGERPGPRDVVLYSTLPKELPRVAGVITAARQTPLSHVNLRAIQDDVPNAFIKGANENPTIVASIGKFVSYRVTRNGFEIREASGQEVEAHFADLRPAVAQNLERDLTKTKIRALTEVTFGDAASVGVKAANLGALRSFGFRSDLTPDGYVVPFYFYHEFMRNNGLYRMANEMILTADFRSDAETRAKSLKRFRKAIKSGEIPRWMMDALSSVQERFPVGTSIRCRSSTNNEDLPGFSGAGLYDSFTHHPREGHLSKSVKQVFASLWSLRAFEEREYYRVDHARAAMGVLLHPSTKNERANGVAISRDVLYQTEDQVGQRFYLNVQEGENLVTNPEIGTAPDELLISPRNPRTDQIIRQVGRRILSADHLRELRRSLRVIHFRFQELYEVPPGKDFAMEIEFKVTKNGRLFIKQARPWVYR